MKHRNWMNLIVALGLLVSSSVVLPTQRPVARAAPTQRVLHVIPGGIASGDCDTWAAACDLQYALSHAASGDELWVAEGTYTPTSGTDQNATFQLRSGVAIYGGFAATETLRTQRDWIAHPTILSGDISGHPSTNSKCVVTGSGVTETAVLDGFILSDANRFGFKMKVDNGRPTLANLAFGDWDKSTTGKVGGALRFDGVDDYVDVGDGITLADSSFTVAFWARRDPVGVDNHNFVLSQGSTSQNEGLHIGFRANNKFTCAFHGDDLDTTEVYTETDWHHWACTYDAATRERILYKDGVQVASDIAGAHYQGSGDLTIGRYLGDLHHFNGAIDEVAVFTRTLDTTEISATVKLGWDGMADQVLGLHLDESPASGGMTLNDASGWANHGSLFTGPINYGGGMYNLHGSSPALTNVTFSDGFYDSDVLSSGMVNRYDSSPTLVNVTFSGNVSAEGGGMYNDHGSSPTLVNVTFSANGGFFGGGGMWNENSSPTLTNVTFSGNGAGEGGGMHNWDSSDPTLTKDLFKNNSVLLRLFRI